MEHIDFLFHASFPLIKSYLKIELLFVCLVYSCFLETTYMLNLIVSILVKMSMQIQIYKCPAGLGNVEEN